MEPEKAFGQVLRALRQERGLSQEELALEAGLQRNYVSLLELGRHSASLKSIFKLSKALGVAPQDLVHQTVKAAARPKSGSRTAS